MAYFYKHRRDLHARPRRRRRIELNRVEPESDEQPSRVAYVLVLALLLAGVAIWRAS